MREIKFRAWDNRKKEFNYNPFLKTGDGRNDWIVFLNQQEQPRQGGDLVFRLPYSRQQFELMQYIGFKDKNGKEIYEGDIVRNSSGRICKVVWFKSPRFLCWDLYALNAEGASNKDWNGWKIIGNIYGNPELLKEKKR